MPRPGFIGGNAAQNVQVVGGVKMFVKLTGSTEWVHLGAASNIEIEPTAEFLDYSSNGRGVNATVKRILTTRALAMNMVLEEINIDNLKFALLGGSPVAGSVEVVETAIVTIGAANLVVLPEKANLILRAVRSDGGGGDYSITGFTPGGGDSTFTAIGATEGDEAIVYYSVTQSTDSEKVEVLDSSLISGSAQLRIRNKHGGLAQVYELDSVEIAPNGAIGLPAEEVQSLPITMTSRELNGVFGRVYSKTVPAS